jgi:preprotein translocase subunit SecB
VTSLNMTKKKSTKPGTETEYETFLKRIEIYALGLDSISAELKREAYGVAHADSATEVTREIKSSFKLIEADEDHFDVGAAFTLRISQKNEELLVIRVSYTAHFHTKKTSPIEKYAGRFAELEARLIFWPYFRQAVSDITARMYIRPVTIPMTLKP